MGPAKTTISAIAEHAGVQRLTVYRHFADQDAIFAACIAHAYELDPPPDPQLWALIASPETRLRKALTATYEYYRRNQRLFANVHRDAELPAVATRLAHNAEMQATSVAVLYAGWSAANGRILAAVIGHALDFSTWQSLAQTRGLSDAEATEAMTVLVKAVVSASAVAVPASIAE